MENLKDYGNKLSSLHDDMPESPARKVFICSLRLHATGGATTVLAPRSR